MRGANMNDFMYGMIFTCGTGHSIKENKSLHSAVRMSFLHGSQIIITLFWHLGFGYVDRLRANAPHHKTI